MISDFNIYGYKDNKYVTIEDLILDRKINTQVFFEKILPKEFGGKRDYYYYR